MSEKNLLFFYYNFDSATLFSFGGETIMGQSKIWVSPSVSSWVSWVPLWVPPWVPLHHFSLPHLYLTLTSLYLILTSLYSILTSLLYSPEYIYIEPAYISSVLTDDLNFIMKVDAEHIATMLFPVRRYCVKSCASFLGDTLRDIWGTFL